MKHRRGRWLTSRIRYNLENYREKRKINRRKVVKLGKIDRNIPCAISYYNTFVCACEGVFLGLARAGQFCPKCTMLVP